MGILFIPDGGGSLVLDDDPEPPPTPPEPPVTGPCDINTLLASAACFSCIPRGFFMPLKLAILAKILEQKGGGTPTVQELLDSAACFSCLTPGQISILRLQLLCALLGGNVLYSYDISGGPTFSNGDPSLNWNFPGQGTPESKQYSLSIVSSNGSSIAMQWTFPSIIGDNTDQYVPRKLYLQRSSTAFKMPKVAFDPPQINQNFYDRSGSSELETAPEHDQGCSITGAGQGDVGWTTIASWNAVANVSDWPTAYTDSGSGPFPPNETVYGYRLIAIFLDNLAGPNARAELDWNVVRSIGEYKLCFENLTCPSPISSQVPRTLVWNAPDTSCWD